MKTRTLVNHLSATLAFGLFIGCSGGLDLSDMDVKLPGQDITANWKSPANYARTPIGQNPVNPITLAVDFSDHTGCPNQTYQFWLFSQDGGTPLAGIGSNTELAFNNHFEQVINLPIDVPVYQIRLACTKANGDRYANSDILESGSPAFTPRYAVSWQNPEGYVRTPSGSQPTNPITLSVNFSDENGCPYQLYRFWSYALNGTPVGPIGPIMTMTPGSGVTMTAALPANTPINAVRLACVDNAGNRYDNTANLEIGNPAFTPIASGTCSGQTTTLCESPSMDSTCTNCGGNWTPAVASTCTGDSSTSGETQCQQQSTQSSCVALGLLDGNGATLFPTSPCEWINSSCHIKSTICTDQVDENHCTVLMSGYALGNCTWTAAIAAACTNPTTTLCASPQSEATCTICGGTWATNP